MHCRTECVFRFGGVGIISGKYSDWSRNIAGAYNMALLDFNEGSLYNEEYMISNIESLSTNSSSSCRISMDLRDSNWGSNDPNIAIQTVIKESFDLAQKYHNAELNIPIILGPGWSSMATSSNALVNAFNMMQISGSATSEALTEYKSFFRTIPTDLVQAKSLVLLCKYFKWKNIGIIYANDDHGAAFQRGILEIGEEYGIITQSFGYILYNNATIENTVSSAKKSGLYIFILIVGGEDHQLFLSAFKKYNMLEYPYYFIGNQIVLYRKVVPQHELPLFGGMIGSCPWSPAISDVFESEYPFPINESSKMYKIYHESWINRSSHSVETLANMFYNITEPTADGIYGYDSALALIKAIDKYIELNYINTIDEFEHMIDIDIAKFGNDIINILKNIWFIGLSGNVSFYQSGDRKGGLYSYCNVNPLTGELNKIGFIIDDIDNDLIINKDNILWPLQFQQHDTIPMTRYIEYPGIATFSSLPAIIWCISFVSIFIVLLYMFFLFYYRNKKIIRASQWKLNVLMLCGCIIAYITVIIYGIDESFPYNDPYLKNPLNWSVLCNVRIILLNISFSFVFGPLLCKVYRIRRLFNVKCTAIILTAKKMALYNLIYVIFELIIIIIIICIIPNNRVYQESITDQETHFIEYYGYCHSNYNYVYYILLFTPKFIGMMYCAILSISVYSTVSIMKYNEGLKIIFIVLFSTLLIIITTLVIYSININNSSSTSFYYGFLSLMLLLISNFVASVMLLPRFISIWKGVDSVYDSDQFKKLNKINAFMKEMRQQLVKPNLDNTRTSSQISTGSQNEQDTVQMATTDIEVNMYNITKR